jgi:hypothetical protein
MAHAPPAPAAPQAAQDLTLLGPPSEEAERKRERVLAMLDVKLGPAVQSIQRLESAGVGAVGQDAASLSPGITSTSRQPSGRGEEPAGPTTPLAAADPGSLYRFRPRKHSWADLADEMPAVVRLPTWPEQLEAAAAAARADPAAAVAAILREAAPEGSPPVSSLRWLTRAGRPA